MFLVKLIDRLPLVSAIARKYHSPRLPTVVPTFKFSSSFIEQKRVECENNSPFGYNGLGELVYRRTYARGGETWFKTCIRVVEGAMHMYEPFLARASGNERADNRYLQDLAQEMFESMFNLRFVPPGRGIWGMGSAITRERHLYAALNNCGFVSTDSLKKDPVSPFVFLMDASMLGVGVGFDTLGAGQIDIVDKNHSLGSFTYIIPDSREGWVEAMSLLLRHYFVPGNHHPKFNYSLIRAAGEQIKGFGGISGGPEPLKHALEEIDKLLDASRGKPISVTNIVDIMNIIGKCIVSGNVRRSAEIAFGDPFSEEFLGLKDYSLNPHRASYGWTSNNSVNAVVGMDYGPIVDRIIQNGEPGLFWLKNAQDYSRMMDPPDYKDKRAKGSNPCITGDTIILTSEGPKRAIDLLDKPFNAFVNGKTYLSRTGIFLTGHKAVFKIKTTEGYSLKLTEEHPVMIAGRNASGDLIGKWRNARDLRLGDSIILNDARLFNDWEGEGDFEEGKEVANMIAEASKFVSLPVDMEICYLSSSKFQKGFITQIFEKLGVIRRIGTENQGLEIHSENVNHLEVTQRMLSHFGIKSTIRLKELVSFQQRKGHFNTLTIERNSIRLFFSKFTITRWGIKRYRILDALPRPKKDSIESFTVTFEALNFHGYEAVYDCTVDEVHCFSADGIIVHNCLEQTLEPYELCCLVETFPARHTNLKEFIRTLELSFLYAKIVTLGPTHWPKTNRVMERNRRIGTSMSGITQFIAKNGMDTLKHWCVEGYKHLTVYDHILSSQLNIPVSIKRTSIKPSGTVSLLAGATPGMHYPISRQYIRRVRMPTGSPLLTPLQKAGYFIEDAKDGIKGSTKVVEFPVSVSDTSIPILEEVTIWQQLALAAFLQEYWADNSVSCTVTFDPEKVGKQEIASALDFYQYKLKGISFLPNIKAGAYPQMPYEAIDEATYHRRMQDIHRIDWDTESKNFVEVKEKTFCDSDTCELKAN